MNELKLNLINPTISRARIKPYANQFQAKPNDHYTEWEFVFEPNKPSSRTRAQVSLIKLCSCLHIYFIYQAGIYV